MLPRIMSITWESNKSKVEFNASAFTRRVRLYSLAAAAGVIVSFVYVFAR
jgi:hypothetical protein